MYSVPKLLDSHCGGRISSPRLYGCCPPLLFPKAGVAGGELLL